jgi:hypothetical protein
MMGIDFRRAGLTLLLAAAAGCGSSTGGSGEVTYDLRLLNGAALPYDHEGLGCCTYLSGTLSLEAGDYAMALTARNRNTSEVFTATEWGTYQQQGTALSFAFDSFAVAPIGLDAGTLSSDTLRVRFGGEGPGSPDQFQGLFVRGP